MPLGLSRANASEARRFLSHKCVTLNNENTVKFNLRTINTVLIISAVSQKIFIKVRYLNKIVKDQKSKIKDQIKKEAI